MQLHCLIEPVYLGIIDDDAYIARDDEGSHYFSIDEVLSSSSANIYRPFRDNSFGPMSLGSIFHFVQTLSRKMIEFKQSKIIVYVSKSDSRNLTNTLFLLGSYMIVTAAESATELWSRFEWIEPWLEKYEICGDPECMQNAFFLDLVDCWNAVARSLNLGWLGTYDMHEYLHYDNPLEGDMHWIIPEKLLAFRCPKSFEAPGTYIDYNGLRSFSAGFYIEPFIEAGISTVIRLNEVDEDEYDLTEFEEHGIKVVNLEFGEDEPPPVYVVAEFLHILDKAVRPVAVHCRTGLVQTGTMIAIHLMRTHDFSAREAIGWLRIVRPGCVIGEHSHFLVSVDSARRTLIEREPIRRTRSLNDTSSAGGGDPPPHSDTKHSVHSAAGVDMCGSHQPRAASPAMDPCSQRRRSLPVPLAEEEEIRVVASVPSGETLAGGSDTISETRCGTRRRSKTPPTAEGGGARRLSRAHGHSRRRLESSYDVQVADSDAGDSTGSGVPAGQDAACAAALAHAGTHGAGPPAAVPRPAGAGDAFQREASQSLPPAGEWAGGGGDVAGDVTERTAGRDGEGGGLQESLCVSVSRISVR